MQILPIEIGHNASNGINTMLTKSINTMNFSAYFDKNYALYEIGCSIDAKNIEGVKPILQDLANTYRGQPYDICSDSLKTAFNELEKQISH